VKNLRIPANQAEWTLFVKSNYWTIAITVLGLIVCWQGLTLYLQMQSWARLERRVDSILLEEKPKDTSEGSNEGEESTRRTVEATFFHHPKSQYKLTAILGDYAVIGGQEVKVGGRIEKATLESIDSNGVTLLEDGSDAPKKILLHPEPEEKKDTGSTDSTRQRKRSSG
jgi:hypothetical protein